MERSDSGGKTAGSVGAMEVVVNGKPREVPDGATVLDLVESLGFGRRQVVVEHNDEPLERARFSEVRLEAGDVVEVVRAVAGG
jgi:sulfur carrier protein